jgi:hypothetical protein
MLLTQLQTLNIPRTGSRALKRTVKTGQAKIQKLAKAKLKKAKSTTRQAVRRQYYFSSAYGDMRQAISRNEDIFITSLIVVTVMSFAAARALFEFLFMFLNTAFALSQLTAVSIMLWIAAACLVVGVLYAWVAAFSFNMLSLSIMEGATGKKLRSVRQTARKSLRRASRVTGVWFCLAALLIVPILLIMAGVLTYLHFYPISQDGLLNLIPKIAVTGVTWICLVLMHFSLAPQVALFEPDLSISQVFNRSRLLVRRRGRIFLLLGHCLLAVVLLAAYKLSEAIEYVLMLDKWVAFSLFLLAAAVMVNGLKTSLYRKRALARRY